MWVSSVSCHITTNNKESKPEYRDAAVKEDDAHDQAACEITISIPLVRGTQE
jgi:hypothetical protein